MSLKYEPGHRYNLRPEDARARLEDLTWSCENELPEDVLDEVRPICIIKFVL